MATGGNPTYIDRYNTDHQRRGLAVIINNVEFKGKMGNRLGSDVDCGELVGALKFLGFNIVVHKDQTRSQMLAIFKSVSEQNHEDADCFVLAILSHGGEGVIYGTDGSIPLSAVCRRFHDDSCPSLQGKPKIFILQACQGTEEDYGHLLEDQYTRLGRSDVAMDSEVYPGSHSPPVTPKIYIPKEPDVLVVLASPPGYVSFRKTRGSWFIKTLCQELNQCHNDTEIMDLLTRVNYRVAYEFETSAKTGRGKKQVPCIMSVLTKKMYLKEK